MLALLIALLFTVHPLQTQSVIYVIQRCQSMMGMFQVLALYCFIRGWSAGVRLPWHLASVLCCIFALDNQTASRRYALSLLIYDRVFLSRSAREMWQRHKLYYFGMLGCWIFNVGDLARFMFFTGALDIGGRGANSEGIAAGMGTSEYVLSQFEMVTWYLRLSFWPNPLCLDYTWPAVKEISEVIPYALIIVPLGLASVFAVIKSPPWGFCGYVVLSEYWSIFQSHCTTGCTRRTPNVRSLNCCHCWNRSVCPLVDCSSLRADGSLLAMPHILCGMGFCIGDSAFVWSLTYRRNIDYQSGLTMWTDVVNKRPNNPRAHNIGMPISFLRQSGNFAKLFA